jgi:pimeloyl-ACP methyl ester carboxylesterase
MRFGPTTPLRGALAVLVSATILLAAACSTDEPEQRSRPSGSKVVTFSAPDGTQLGGVLTGRGDTGVVLAHQFNADQSAWFPFAEELASRRYQVLTFNFRGFCAESEADCPRKDPAKARLDLQGALAFMKQQDVDKIFVVGASMGGTAALAEMPRRADAVVVLSAPKEFQGLRADPGNMQKTPVLFIAARDDPAGAAVAAQQLYEAAPKPKQLLIVPSEEHGAYLLEDPASGEEVRQAILRFLDLYRSAA